MSRTYQSSAPRFNQPQYFDHTNTNYNNDPLPLPERDTLQPRYPPPSQGYDRSPSPTESLSPGRYQERTGYRNLPPIPTAYAYRSSDSVPSDPFPATSASDPFGGYVPVGERLPPSTNRIPQTTLSPKGDHVQPFSPLNSPASHYNPSYQQQQQQQAPPPLPPKHLAISQYPPPQTYDRMSTRSFTPSPTQSPRPQPSYIPPPVNQDYRSSSPYTSQPISTNLSQLEEEEQQILREMAAMRLREAQEERIKKERAIHEDEMLARRIQEDEEIARRYQERERKGPGIKLPRSITHAPGRIADKVTKLISSPSQSNSNLFRSDFETQSVEALSDEQERAIKSLGISRKAERQLMRDGDLDPATFQRLVQLSEANTPRVFTGLDPEIARRLPVISFQQDLYPNATECLVCLEEFEEFQQLKEIPSCGHRFHLVCLERWLADHRVCPICRRDI